MPFESSPNTTDYKREGLKYIAAEVKNVLKSGESLTYSEICAKIHISRPEILKRRVYDVLSVMSALHMVSKDKKRYKFIQRDLEVELKEEIREYEAHLLFLKKMRRAFTSLVNKNQNRDPPSTVERYYLPFVLVIFDSSAKIKCEINDDRTHFLFSSSKPIHQMKEFEIINEMFTEADSDM
ncbi:Transcription factor Dp-1 [Cucumispora dikerogammari]|nr:Transcription factor Dp-1 [Cucumispora dikerogammari]